MGLAAQIDWTGGVTETSGNLSASSRFGTAPTPSGSWALTDGTGSAQANQVYESLFTIAAGVTLQIDLKSGAGEKDVLNLALAMTAVKSVEVLLSTTPAAGVSLQLGPQGLANAAQLWFQAATANFYDTIRDRFANQDRAVGWALDATHKIVGVKNPGAGSVSGWLRIIGTQ